MKNLFVFASLFLFACHNSNQKPNEETSLIGIEYSAKSNYQLNPFTGLKIEPSISFSGDTINSFKSYKVEFEYADQDTILPPEKITSQIIKEEFILPNTDLSFNLKSSGIKINLDELETFTPGIDYDSSVMITDFGDTLKTNIPLKAEVKKLNINWSEPILVNSLDQIIDSKYDVTTLGLSQGLRSNKVNRVELDKEGNLWIGTRAGIALYDGQHLFNFNKSNALT